MKKKNTEEKTQNLKEMRERSFKEIGDKLNLTRMRICQIEKSILKKIKESFNENDFI